ncbi:MAG: rhomboid family intramembrane serine protease [Chitinophagales bacterium]|nr:rhomboid family intramembrane serine protease [Chitinophagales bacterium]MCZ2392573.1 rhomboid family intramembrane serine protease [Chitinophagales bacterium]
MYTNPSIWQEIKYKYQYGGAHIKIIFINIAVFILLNLILFVDRLVFDSLGRSFILDQLLGSSSLLQNLYKPWIIITNLFVHDVGGFSHIFFNMLVLYIFGNIVKDLIGNSKVTPIFLLSGLAGYFIFIIAYHLIPGLNSSGAVTICGASGGVMGITFAAVAISPNFELHLLFLGRVKIKWIALFYLFINIIMLQGNNAGGSIAHLGGALIGFLFVRQLRNGVDWGKPFYWVEDQIENLKTIKRKPKFVYKKEEKVIVGESKKQNKTTPQRPTRSNNQERLDEILDKISQSGYDSLNQEEKSFLFKISQED